MVSDFLVVMDSGGDPLRPEHEKYMVVPMNIIFDGSTYKYPGDLTREDVVNVMRSHGPGEVRTSQPSPKQIVNAIESLGVENVLYITLSSGLSGTFNSAVIASRLLEKRGITMVPYDSRAVAAQQGYLLAKALELRDAGHNMQEVVAELDRIRPQLFARFAVPTLDYLVAGGRLDPFRAAIAKLVGIRPILWINRDGGIDVEQTVRKKDLWRKFADGACGDVYLVSAPNSQEELQLAEKKLVERGCRVVARLPLSPVILVHTGLNLVGELHHGPCGH